MITKRLATRYPRASDNLSDRHPYNPRDVDNIAAFAPNVKAREVALAFNSRAPSKLIAVLQRNDVSDVDMEEALSLLQSLLLNQSKRMDTINKGAAKTCSNLVQHDNVFIACLAIQALTSIASVRAGRQDILKYGSINFIASHLLDTPSSDLRKCAAAFFERVAQCEDGAAMLLRDDAEAFLAVLRTFRTHQELPGAKMNKQQLAVAKSLSFCIADVSRLNPAVTFLLEDGDRNVERLVGALQHTQSDDQVLLNAVSAITSIARCDAGKATTIGFGGVKALCSLLAKRDSSIRIGAVCALRMISSSKQGKPYYGKEEQVEQLVMALTDESLVVRKETASAISTASEDSNVLHAFVQKLAVYKALLQFVFPMEPRASQCLLAIIGTVSGKNAQVEPNVIHAAAQQVLAELEREGGIALMLGTKRPVQLVAARIVTVDTRDDTAGLCAKILHVLFDNSKRVQTVLRRIIDDNENSFKDHTQEDVQQLYQLVMTET